MARSASGRKDKTRQLVNGGTGSSRGEGVRRVLINDKSLPLVYEPLDHAARQKDFLPAYISRHRKDIERNLHIYGAVLFRGFQITNEHDFERAVLAFDNKLGTEYLGTSPRNGKTRYVHTASELPSAFPIMQHAEMSFLDNPPHRLFFYAKTAPQKNGETPFDRLAVGLPRHQP